MVVDDLINAALKPSTKQMYKKNWSTFQRFILSVLKQSCSLPVPGHTVTLFIGYLFKKHYRYATILTYISAISFHHKINNTNDPTATFMVQKVLQGTKNCQPPSSPLLPLTKHMLHRIIDCIPYATSDTYERALYKALFLTMYHACLRIGEVVPSGTQENTLALQNIVFTSNNNKTAIAIKFTSYKHSNGLTPTLLLQPSNDNYYCPVRALQAYIHKRGPQPGNLFISQSYNINRSQVAQFLKRTVTLAGYDSQKISTHSLRIGRTTDIAKSKLVSESTLQSIGRWKSSAYQKYIRPTTISLPP